MFNFWIVFLEWLKLFGDFILFWGISLSLPVYIKLIYKQLSSAANIAMKRKEMTTERKETVIRLVNEGRFQRKISNTLRRSTSAVIKFLIRFTERESLQKWCYTWKNLKRMKRSDRQIVRVARTNIRTAVLTGIVNQTLPHKISSRTVCHRFKFNRYTRRKVKKTLTINKTERKRCISRCRQKLQS